MWFELTGLIQTLYFLNKNEKHLSSHKEIKDIEFDCTFMRSNL